MKITVRRVYDFGGEATSVGADLLTPQAWDAARDCGWRVRPRGKPGGVGSRAAPRRRTWRGRARCSRSCTRSGRPSLLARPGRGADRAAAAPARPGLRITCADFAPAPSQRLRELFDEDVEVVVRDLGADGPLPGDLHFMHRIDQELARGEWHAVFAQIDAPCCSSPRPCSRPPRGQGDRPQDPAAARHVRRLFRNEAALRALWCPWFDDRPVTIGGLRASLLSP